MRKNDILLILAALLLGGVLWGVLTLTKRLGGEAVVTVDGETFAVLPLSKDTALGINADYLGTGEDGFANVIVVEDGRVCVKDADCPDKICVRTGWIQYKGESIVCLPHKLVVTIRSGKQNLDAHTG